MSDITQLLNAIQHGDPCAGEALLPLLYDELRALARAKMAREQPGHTLQPTALVHEAGLRLGLVTSGSRTRVERELAGLDLARHFEAIICAGDTEERKPHPAPLLAALAQMGVGAHESAYVGDSPEDVQMARAAGVFAIGIPGPFPNRDLLEAAEPDLLVNDLASAVAALLERR